MPPAGQKPVPGGARPAKARSLKRVIRRTPIGGYVIRLGPAGIPLSSSGRTIEDGITYTRELGLNAMEVQFVRGITIDEEYAEQCGEQAAEADIPLSVHAPYYTNLATDNESTLEKSIQKIKDAGEMAQAMGAHLVVVNPGFYTSHDKDETVELVTERLRKVRDWYTRHDLDADIGLKTMGKQKTFGTLDEVVEITGSTKHTKPVVNLGNIHGRTNGSLQEPEDFKKILDRVADIGVEHFHLQFSGVQYESGNVVNTIPIKKSDLDFEPLLDCILDNDLDVTVISDSPIVEHDAMHMKLILEREVEKRELDMEEIFPPPAEIEDEGDAD